MKAVVIGKCKSGLKEVFAHGHAFIFHSGNVRESPPSARHCARLWVGSDGADMASEVRELTDSRRKQTEKPVSKLIHSDTQ